MKINVLKTVKGLTDIKKSSQRENSVLWEIFVLVSKKWDNLGKRNGKEMKGNERGRKVQLKKWAQKRAAEHDGAAPCALRTSQDAV